MAPRERDRDREPRGEPRGEPCAAELEAILAAIASALVIYGPRGEIVRMNAAARALLGDSDAERGAPLARRAARVGLARPDGSRYAVEETPIARALRGEVTPSVLASLHRPGGVTWLAISAAPLRQADGTVSGAVASFADVTALREAQERQRDTARAIAHDVRTPLGIIRLQAERARRLLAGAGGRDLGASAGGPPLAAALDAIVAATGRIDAMLADLVESARLESGSVPLAKERCAVRDIVEECAGLLPELERRLHVQVPPVRRLVDVDRGQFRRVLQNLLENAVRYAPPGSPIGVRVEARDREVIVSVTDRGPGIAPEDLHRVFERGYRGAAGRERATGSGLGLHIARLIVQAHGGRIWAESQVGDGTTFHVALPEAAAG